MAFQRCRLVALAALLVSATSAQNCDYSKNGYCIKAEASASVTFPFEPLFTSPPKFVFAIDNLEDQDIQDIINLDKYISAPAKGKPAQAVSWWLEYDNSTVNRNQSQQREYYAWALESNSTNEIGGNDGGCEKLLSAQCVSDLKNLFTGVNGAPLEALQGYLQTPPRINCPTMVWDRRVLPLWGGRNTWFARMSNTFLWTSDPPKSGNASYTHAWRQMRYRSFEEQKSTAVIAFNLGRSLVESGRDNTTINMACLRVGAAPGTATQGGDSGNSAGKTAATSTMVLGVIAAVWVFVG